MTGSPLERRIEWTGSSSILLGVICLGIALLEAVVPALLRRLEPALGAGDDPTRALRESWSAGAPLSALLNGVFGVALVIVGFGVARRARWAHPALTIACWASIAVVVGLAKPTIDPFVALLGPGTGAHAIAWIAGGALVVAQVAAVIWFLRFWRTPEVRSSFT